MTIKFARRTAAELTKRGAGAIRINPSALEEVKKAMTREDVRALLKSGSIFAMKPKHNVSLSSKKLKIRRAKGRGRGPGKRKGTMKARQGMGWIKRARSQRLLLKRLRSIGKLDGKTFNTYYMLVKGGTFADKGSLMLHLREDGIMLTEEETKATAEFIKSRYRQFGNKRASA